MFTCLPVRPFSDVRGKTVTTIIPKLEPQSTNMRPSRFICQGVFVAGWTKSSTLRIQSIYRCPSKVGKCRWDSHRNPLSQQIPVMRIESADGIPTTILHSKKPCVRKLSDFCVKIFGLRSRLSDKGRQTSLADTSPQTFFES